MACHGGLEDGDVEDYEYPDEDDADADADVAVPCPYCGEAVYEDGEQCPGCGRHRSREDAPGPRKPVWLVVGFLLCTTGLLGWLLWS